MNSLNFIKMQQTDISDKVCLCYDELITFFEE